MKAVLIMYDSLNRRYLPPYGKEDIIAPNFTRLAEHSVTFDNFYCGSMPCMPARREIQTGRYNFLHRSWGPLEPFDDSCPEILSDSGICTQFVSDHAHYWQDGGLTYHQRFSAFEFVRGQEGDEWHARADGFRTKRNPRRQDAINREYTRDDSCCHARCFEAARDFIINNHDSDNWYLHLEYFDPHEPFDAPERYKRLYTDEPVPYDWPVYGPVEDPEQVREAIKRLAPGYRVVLSLYLFEGYDMDEIAQILNLKPVSVRSQYMRAKKRLLEEISVCHHG